MIVLVEHEKSPEHKYLTNHIKGFRPAVISQGGQWEEVVLSPLSCNLQNSLSNVIMAKHLKIGLMLHEFPFWIVREGGSKFDENYLLYKFFPNRVENH